MLGRLYLSTGDSHLGYKGLALLTENDGTTVTHNPRGDMTSDGARTYTYNHDDLMSGTTDGVDLGYDPLMRLQEASGPSGTTQFGYDGIAMDRRI